MHGIRTLESRQEAWLSSKWYTVECRYSAVKYCEILHKYLQKLRKNINQILDPQKTLQRSSYGVSFVNIYEKIDQLITAPHCISIYKGMSAGDLDN